MGGTCCHVHLLGEVTQVMVSEQPRAGSLCLGRVLGSVAARAWEVLSRLVCGC